MKTISIMLVVMLLTGLGCNKVEKNSIIEKWKKEIAETEIAFAELAAKEGIPQAFLTYAADDVVLMRNQSLVEGKNALREFYHNNPTGSANVSLAWTPDFVDVSAAGDPGYTYGK